MNRRRPLMGHAAWIAAVSAGLVLAAAFALPVRADDDSLRRNPSTAAARPADVALWREECGACHVAYPARMLPARDWSQIMRALDRHFGTDASLDAAAAARIEGYLTRFASAPTADNAPRARTAAPNVLPRITTQRWFLREHDEIPASTWKDKRVGSAARCDACHLGAAQGRFDENDIRRLP